MNRTHASVSEQLRRIVAGPIGMQGCLVEGVDAVVVTSVRHGDARDRRLAEVEGELVVGLLEERQRLRDEPCEVGRVLVGVDVEGGSCGRLDPCAELADAIAAGSGSSRRARRLGALHRLTGVVVQTRTSASALSTARSISAAGTSDAARSSSRLAAGKSWRRAARRPALVSRRRAARVLDAVVVGEPLRPAVADSLIEVVADQLVDLHQSGCVVLEPGRELRVALGPGGQAGVVGGVADQAVAEAKAVFAREQRAVGPDQLLRTSAASRGPGAAPDDASACTAPR